MDRHTVLLVDDEEDIVQSVRFNLEQEGYNVLSAVDGEEGLEKALQDEPDLIVLDVMMPKENGYRVARRIREEEQAGHRTKRTPIILLTARKLQDDPDRERMFLDFSGADLMMYKPFEMDDLTRSIRKLLS